MRLAVRAVYTAYRDFEPALRSGDLEWLSIEVKWDCSLRLIWRSTIPYLARAQEYGFDQICLAKLGPDYEEAIKILSHDLLPPILCG